MTTEDMASTLLESMKEKDVVTITRKDLDNIRVEDATLSDHETHVKAALEHFLDQYDLRSQ